MPGIIIPRKTVGELQKLVDDPDVDRHRRTVGCQDPLHHRQRRADLEADRRHLPGLSARHPDRQRQGADASTAQTFAAAVDRVSTISSERGRAVKLALGDGQLTLTVNNPGFRQRDRRTRRRLRVATRSRSASTPDTCSTSPASCPGRERDLHAGRCRFADADPRHGRRRRALRADADAGVRPDCAAERAWPTTRRHRADAVRPCRDADAGDFRNYAALALDLDRRHRRAHRRQRRRQDQSARSDLPPVAGPRACAAPPMPTSRAQGAATALLCPRADRGHRRAGRDRHRHVGRHPGRPGRRGACASTAPPRRSADEMLEHGCASSG